MNENYTLEEELKEKIVNDSRAYDNEALFKTTLIYKSENKDCVKLLLEKLLHMKVNPGYLNKLTTF